MYKNETAMSDLTAQTSFPADATIKIAIRGLAYSKLDPKTSEINFLSHVPHHELDMTIAQKRRGSNTEISKRTERIEPEHAFFIKADNSVAPDAVEVRGDFPLSEIVNISRLHGRGKIKYKTGVPANLEPIILTITDCGFYTAVMTDAEFDIIETRQESGDKVAETKKIGYVMGGKIKCEDGADGSLSIEIRGSRGSNIEFPLSDADGEFVYEILLDNHCTDIAKCREEIGEEGSDFKYYYDLLEDSQEPDRKFKIIKASGEITPRGVEIAACNPIITQPEG